MTDIIRPHSTQELRQLMLEFQRSPSLFVRKVFKAEPSKQQESILEAVAKPGARVSVKSGHGTGKSTTLAWLVHWHVSCFDDSKAPCTAPTGHQLNDVLWAEIAKWHQKMHPWFKNQIEVTRDMVFVKGNREGQFAVARTSRAENPEALQGFHATNVLYLIDEASGVPDPIFEPMRGALSTAGARVVMAANPTRMDGMFYDTHHKMRDSWTRIQLSCVDSPFATKEYIEEMKRDYGEDSDIYRVRVLGDFPRAGINQLIPTDLAESRMGKHLRDDQYKSAPIVLGVDVAWEGDDRSVVYMRQGLYSKCLFSQRGIDNMTLAERVAGWWVETDAQACFVDVGWGTGVIDRLRQLGFAPVAVNFGGKARKEHRFQNKRAEMWCEMKDWLVDGGVVEDDKDLRDDMTSPMYFFTPSGKIQLESKKDMKKRRRPSPDKADALALTFAAPIVPRAPARLIDRRVGHFTNHAYDPLR